MSRPSQKWNAWWVLGLSLLAGVFLYVGWAMSSRGPGRDGMSRPLLVAFPDGGELEVYGTSVGQRVLQFPRPPWILRWWVKRTGSSGYSTGHLNVNREEENGKLVRCTATTSASANGLLIELCLREPNGMPVDLPRYLTERNAVFGERRIGGDQTYGELKISGESPEEWRETLAKVDMQLLIQHRDPQAGWIHLMGPCLLDETLRDRNIAVLPAWQRDLPVLDFRAIRADGLIVEFSLENPDLKPAAPGTFAAAPLTHSAADYSLTLAAVNRKIQPGAHPSCAFDLKLVPIGAGLDSAFYLRLEASQAVDEFGNQLPLKFGNKVALANLPTAAKRASLRVKVERMPAYPRAESAGYTVLEGVVRADGSAVDFTLMPDAARFEIPVPPAGKISNKMLEFEIEGKMGPPESAPIQSRIGDPGEWEYLVFPGASTDSAGVPQSRGGGWGGDSRSGKMTFSRNTAWEGPPSAFLPGERFRIGIHGKLPDDDVKFEVELPGK